MRRTTRDRPQNVYNRYVTVWSMVRKIDAVTILVIILILLSGCSENKPTGSVMTPTDSAETTPFDHTSTKLADQTATSTAAKTQSGSADPSVTPTHTTTGTPIRTVSPVQTTDTGNLTGTPVGTEANNTPERTPTVAPTTTEATTATETATPTATSTQTETTDTPVVTPTPSGNESDPYDCSDFDSWQAAQEVLDSTPGDPSELDENDNGIACESLRE